MLIGVSIAAKLRDWSQSTTERGASHCDARISWERQSARLFAGSAWRSHPSQRTANGRFRTFLDQDCKNRTDLARNFLGFLLIVWSFLHEQQTPEEAKRIVPQLPSFIPPWLSHSPWVRQVPSSPELVAHFVPDTGKRDVNDGREPNDGSEPMPNKDVVVGVVCVCGTRASKH